ncbi:hypothetical protein CKO28_00935 [Rhodovibrio sodomensis]|uniref:Uncharacterized protein n=1 Tax=Rhodovibrio sodomensis TaxID=1088 RepID=A0ABS1D9G3_9PROT|nr:hypothetical protein [Rhodovibrio sodomensis]MBK1666607.1 hypothetical protein [Rhodovibrio sodomensis]
MTTTIVQKRAKAMARTLQDRLKTIGGHPGYSWCLDTVAALHGYASYTDLERQVPARESDRAAAATPTPLHQQPKQALLDELYHRGEVVQLTRSVDWYLQTYPQLTATQVFARAERLNKALEHSSIPEAFAVIEDSVFADLFEAAEEIAAEPDARREAVPALVSTETSYFRTASHEVFGLDSRIAEIRYHREDDGTLPTLTAYDAQGGAVLSPGDLDRLEGWTRAIITAELEKTRMWFDLAPTRFGPAGPSDSGGTTVLQIRHAPCLFVTRTRLPEPKRTPEDTPDLMVMASFHPTPDAHSACIQGLADARPELVAHLPQRDA